MNCPVCGKEMERGILYTELGRGLFSCRPAEKWGSGIRSAAWNSAAGSFLTAPIIYRGAIARLYTAMSAGPVRKSFWSIEITWRKAEKRDLQGGASMNCPVCGIEMEKGHIITKNSIGLFFMP